MSVIVVKIAFTTRLFQPKKKSNGEALTKVKEQIIKIIVLKLRSRITPTQQNHILKASRDEVCSMIISSNLGETKAENRRFNMEKPNTMMSFDFQFWKELTC